jgi:hydroxycarboxylate dehydrogenase B
MPVFTAAELRDTGRRLFQAVGAPPGEAALVADELVDASLMGLDSHGVARFPMYVDQALDGTVKPGAPITVVRETDGTAVVDCGSNYGMVGGRRMVEIVRQKAERTGLACAVSLRCNHVGRLGAYPQRLAEAGLFGLAAVNSSLHGHFVSPWGGREGRLATNPLAWAAPGEPHPVVMDMSTSMIAEGKIRVLMHEGKPLPEGAVLDAGGAPTTDPSRFYGPPRGTILPFGSPRLGYKGFGLGLLVEILGSTIAGVPLDAKGAKPSYVNGLFLLCIDPGALGGRERFRGLLDELFDYVGSSAPAPGTGGVVMPGHLDFATAQARATSGIPVPDETWRLIGEAGRKAGVAL